MTQIDAPFQVSAIFCDGACSGNPGDGGWGAILLVPEAFSTPRGAKSADPHPLSAGGTDASAAGQSEGASPDPNEIADQYRVLELTGGPHFKVTNNQMELLAAREALRQLAALNPLGPIHVYTDSSYLIFGITRWIHGWKRKQWTTQEGSTVLNRDLWESLDRIVRELGPSRIHWGYVRGHAGVSGNERVDELAVASSKGKFSDLYSGGLSDYSTPLLPLPPCEPPPESNGQKFGSNAQPKTPVWYLSLVGGTLNKHATWAECEARVKGVAGAKFKKISSHEEESTWLKKWGLRGGE